MYYLLVGKYFFLCWEIKALFWNMGEILSQDSLRQYSIINGVHQSICWERDSDNQTQAIAGVCQALKLSFNMKSTILNGFYVILYLAFITVFCPLTLVSADYQVLYVIYNASILHRQCPYLYQLRHCHVDGKRDNWLLLCQSAEMQKISNILILNYFDHRNIFGARM